MKTFISNLSKSAVNDIINAYSTGKNSEWFNSVDPETMEIISNGAEHLDTTRRMLFNNVVSFHVKSTSKKVNDLMASLEKANEKALKLSNHEDGGACNFDSCVIRLDGFTKREVFDLSVLSGYIGGGMSGKFWKGFYWVDTAKYGQGNRRSAMAQAACESLKADGYSVCMYCQMD